MGLIRTWNVILTTLLNLGSTLRESGTLSVIPPYAFVMSTSTSTDFPASCTGSGGSISCN